MWLAKITVEHNDQLTSRQNFVAIPEDPEEWENERRFSSRLNKLLNQHEDGIEHFKIVGFSEDEKEVCEPQDVESHLNW